MQRLGRFASCVWMRLPDAAALDHIQTILLNRRAACGDDQLCIKAIELVLEATGREYAGLEAPDPPPLRRPPYLRLVEAEPADEQDHLTDDEPSD